MNQEWFELTEIRKRNFSKSVWIPLRASQEIVSEGESGREGFKEEFFGAGSIMFSLDKRAKVETLGWTDIGISHDHKSSFDDGRYWPVDIYEYWREGELGIHPVLEQTFNSQENREWHLNQDIAFALGLKKENDIWVCPEEDYVEVVRLKRNAEGSPVLIEIRAEFLKDYLCARNMALYITSYRDRTEIFANASHIKWASNPLSEKVGADEWRGHIAEIHEGGMPFDSATHVMHVARTDVDVDEDIPILGLPSDENMASKSWTKKSSGKKLFRVSGELWRNETIEPSDRSPRIKRDKEDPTVFFVTDEKGKKESKETLKDSGRYLWFKPEVVNLLVNRRGGKLIWYTKDTGKVGCSPDYAVHFGINTLGLVTVYAKDIVLLPDWQQAIWAGCNVSPEGGISAELHKSQVEARPATTQAPEPFLKKGLEQMNSLANEKFRKSIWRGHSDIDDLLKKTHRFRAVDKAGLYGLAKDVARLTADSFDVGAMQSIVAPPQGTKLGSLKSLENMLSAKVGKDNARTIMAPLAGAYDLRHADAHLAGSDVDESFKLLEIDQTLPFPHQGQQLLKSCVDAIYSVIDVLKNWNENQK